MAMPSDQPDFNLHQLRDAILSLPVRQRLRELHRSLQWPDPPTNAMQNSSKMSAPLSLPRRSSTSTARSGPWSILIPCAICRPS